MTTIKDIGGTFFLCPCYKLHNTRADAEHCCGAAKKVTVGEVRE